VLEIGQPVARDAGCLRESILAQAARHTQGACIITESLARRGDLA
jgi:hypothetical protein